MLPPSFIAYHNSNRLKEGSLRNESPGWFLLWPLKEIEEWNRRYEVSDFAPGYVGFGSNGGGEMLAFDSNGRIYMLPFIGNEPGQEILVAESWEAFEVLVE